MSKILSQFIFILLCWVLSPNNLLCQMAPETPFSEVIGLLESRHHIHIVCDSEIYNSQVPFDLEKMDFNAPTDEVLYDILSKTTLAYKYIGEETYVVKYDLSNILVYGYVKDQQEKPLIGAHVYCARLRIGTNTDINGAFTFKLPVDQRLIEISYIGYQEYAKTISIDSAQYSIRIDAVLKENPHLQEIVILGSRVAPSSLLDIASPVSVLSTKDPISISNPGLSQLLHFNIPSFHSTQQTISDGTDHIDPATLRGLGPDQLLVLVNGKRRHQSALVNINGTLGKGTVGTDINALPAKAISRIEVLSDGATAQYGSDAIAGVINIILKEKMPDTEFNLNYGVTSAGDGSVIQVAGSHAFNLGKKGGFLHTTVSTLARESINRSGAYQGVIFGDHRDNDSDEVEAFHNATGYDNGRIMTVGSASAVNYSLSVNGNVPIHANDEFYFFGNANFRESQSSGFYRLPFQKSRQSGLYPYGFSPKLQSRIRDIQLVAGYKKDTDETTVDISNSLGSNRILFDVSNSNNASYGLESPIEAAVGSFSYTENITDIDISFKPHAIPVHLSAGAEIRFSWFNQMAGDEASYANNNFNPDNIQREGGIQMFPGFRPENEVSAVRSNIGSYINIESRTDKPLYGGLALRYELYEDFGDNISWKIYGRYKVKDRFAIRGSINTGFRAPSLPQIYFNSLSNQFVITDNGQESVRIAHLNNESIITSQFGINGLIAEKSTNYNIGLSSQLTSGLSLVINAYEIDIRDRIVISGNVKASDDALFDNILTPHGIARAQFFMNAIDTKTLGSEIILKYSKEFNTSKLDFSISSNFSRTRLRRDQNGDPIINVPSQLEGYESILINREEVARIESAQPLNKQIMQAAFITSKWNIGLRMARFGQVTYHHPDQSPALNAYNGKVESRDQVFSPKVITDINLTYTFSNQLAITCGGNNIFNIFPDQHSHSANVANGIFTYSRRVQQFGLMGAYYYLNFNLKI